MNQQSQNQRLDDPNHYSFQEASLFNMIVDKDLDEKLMDEKTKELETLLNSKGEKAVEMINAGAIKDWEWLPGSVERLNQKIKDEPKEMWDNNRLAVFSKYEADVIFHGFPDDSWENRCSYARSCYEVCKNIITSKKLWKDE